MILYIFFYSYFIVKPHEAQMFWCTGHLLLVKPPKAQMLWCWGYFVLFVLFLVLGLRTELWPKCVADHTCKYFYGGKGCWLMYIASFMALATFCPSLPVIMMLSTVVVWQVVFWWSNISDGAFKCSLYSLQMFWLTSLCTHHHI